MLFKQTIKPTGKTNKVKTDKVTDSQTKQIKEATTTDKERRQKTQKLLISTVVFTMR
jgi:hypothetical protein